VSLDERMRASAADDAEALEAAEQRATDQRIAIARFGREVMPMSQNWNVIEGDCVEEMAKMDECSIDAIVCDP
jgi:predicted methyltransferase